MSKDLKTIIDGQELKTLQSVTWTVSTETVGAYYLSMPAPVVFRTGIPKYVVSLQAAPKNLCKHIWIMREEGFDYEVKFKKYLIGTKCVGYTMTKEII